MYLLGWLLHKMLLSHVQLLRMKHLILKVICLILVDLLLCHEILGRIWRDSDMLIRWVNLFLF